MQKILKISTALIFTTCAAGCTAQSQPKSQTEAAPQKQYLEMSEAEQQAALNQLIQQSLQSDKSMPQHSTLKLTYIGDAAEDMFYSVGIYQKHLTKEHLNKAESGFVKTRAKFNNLCDDPEVIAMTQKGLGYQVIMKDISGKRVFESKICKGAKSAKPTVKLRGLSAAR